MANPYLGQIMPVGFNFAPRGWLLCTGSLLPISQNQALFSLLGTTFGGDGRVSFGVPDLRGRTPRGVGSGAGLDHVSWGEKAGSYEVTITTSHMPSHNHTIYCHNEAGDTTEPAGAVPAAASEDIYSSGGSLDNTMKAAMCGNTGGTQPLNIMNPFLGIYYCISNTGVFPPRS